MLGDIIVPLRLFELAPEELFELPVHQSPEFHGTPVVLLRG